MQNIQILSPKYWTAKKMVEDDFLNKNTIPVWKEEFFKEHNLFQEKHPFSRVLRNLCIPFFKKMKEQMAINVS